MNGTTCTSVNTASNSNRTPIVRIRMICDEQRRKIVKVKFITEPQACTSRLLLLGDRGYQEPNPEGYLVLQQGGRAPMSGVWAQRAGFIYSPRCIGAEVPQTLLPI
jgi:hypothetical protein